jgi:hypothetical protein
VAEAALRAYAQDVEIRLNGRTLFRSPTLEDTAAAG